MSNQFTHTHNKINDTRKQSKEMWREREREK